MKSMEKKDYRQKIEIAKKAIEGLKLDSDEKNIAFSKIIDDLLREEVSNKIITPSIKRKGIKKNKEEEIPVVKNEDFISQINAEDFPDIHNLTSKLDLALYLLKVLRDNGISDGLIPSQVAKILTDKFRIKSNQFNMGMAMSKARELLDRDKITTRGGIAYRYKIMKKGEDYITKKISEIHNHSGSSNSTDANLNSSQS